ncbi:hypothetical protein [Iamia sp.]|uniref:hypothetical protein n=1 Tax=Iamia sp. TaxID=2722710 RepID=UPI002BDE77E0|nr:hypothetical protein [Iamia sp.]HXH59382.1 hypothetical protein [Iamia sp.]
MRVYFHGTVELSARELLDGAPLDRDVARQRSAGSEGGCFYLATELDDAIFLGSLHDASLVVIRIDIDQVALARLLDEGCHPQPIPLAGARVPFAGEELVVVPSAFGTFNTLRETGRIVFDEQTID